MLIFLSDVLPASASPSASPSHSPDLSPSPSPSPSAGDEDCELEGGKYVQFHCPYESILMEHCYKCFVPRGESEVIICDGWSQEDVYEQCTTSYPLPSPSPEIDA
jgi:hypothetical protein